MSVHDAAKLMEKKVEKQREEIMYFRQFKMQNFQQEKKLHMLRQECQEKEAETVRIQHELELTLDREAMVQSEISALNAQIRNYQAQLLTCQNERLEAVTQRNSMKTRLDGVLKELRRLVGPGRSVQDVEVQLKERNQLQLLLSLEKARVKELEDELSEYKYTVTAKEEYQKMDQQQIQQVFRHNAELRRLTQNLSDALAEKEFQLAEKDQVARVLAERFQKTTTDDDK